MTAGVGSKLGKGVKVLGKLAKGEKAAEAVKSSEKIVDAAVTQWKSVEALLHTFKGNIQKTSDGIFKLKNGMHTEKGFEHFLAMSKNSGKNFPIRTVERFSAENFTSEILKQKLPNGVTRIQLPKEAWVNSKYYGKAVGDSSDGLIKGAKTLFPESFTPANIAEAAESILVQNADSAERALNGVYKGVKIRLLRDYESKKIKSIFPRWNQE